MKFNIDDYKGKYAMHCKTEEEARDFCNYLYNIGKRWRTGEKYKKSTCYAIYTINTAYNFNEDSYSDVAWYRDNGYTILEWSDFMNKEFTKADLKTGDVVKFRNDDVGILILELDIAKLDSDDYINLDDTREDLTDAYFKEWDIIAVIRPNFSHECSYQAFEKNYGTLVYERKEVEEMTLAEVCKLLGKEIKIVQ